MKHEIAPILVVPPPLSQRRCLLVSPIFCGLLLFLTIAKILACE